MNLHRDSIIGSRETCFLLHSILNESVSNETQMKALLNEKHYKDENMKVVIKKIEGHGSFETTQKNYLQINGLKLLSSIPGADLLF